MEAHVHKLLGSLLPSASSRLMTKPADHTANSAKVVRVSKTKVPGLSLLHLIATPTLHSAKTNARIGAGSGAGSGVESGFESVVSESEAEEAVADSSAEYALPLLARTHCDTDVHVVPLKTYLDTLRYCAASTHACVPFATAGDSVSLAKPTEDIWEGRIFDSKCVHDPVRYPKSLYKSLHTVWYRCLAKNKKGNLYGEQWVFDSEQTDNHVSPWDTQPSSQHGRWTKVYPDLAKLHRPRMRRGVYQPNAIVEAPDSMDIERLDAEAEDLHQDAIERVLKMLLSNEASGVFFHPVPAFEIEYHQQVRCPICLAEILDTFEGGRYESYAQFASDIDQLISNSILFNEEDTM